MRRPVHQPPALGGEVEAIERERDRARSAAREIALRLFDLADTDPERERLDAEYQAANQHVRDLDTAAKGLRALYGQPAPGMPHKPSTIAAFHYITGHGPRPDHKRLRRRQHSTCTVIRRPARRSTRAAARHTRSRRTSTSRDDGEGGEPGEPPADRPRRDTGRPRSRPPVEHPPRITGGDLVPVRDLLPRVLAGLLERAERARHASLWRRRAHRRARLGRRHGAPYGLLAALGGAA